MSAPSSGPSGPRVNVTLEAMLQAQRSVDEELSAEQGTSVSAMQNYLQETVVPFPRLPKTEKNLESQRERVQKALKMGKHAEKLSSPENIRDQAEQFQQKNSEFRSNALILLRERIKDGDTAEEILAKVQELYTDPALQDEALDFLLATSEGDLAKNVRDAKETLKKLFEREIVAGRNIGQQAREAAAKGLGTPTSLRDMYRDITGNPRDSTTLFHELSQNYAFKDLKKVMDFLLHSLGADLKSKGPSIPRGQLYRLLTETRSLQAILGVYRFFRNRMDLVSKLFQKEGMEVPSTLNFETLSKQFMTLASDRFPSSDKVLQTAVRLGIEKWILAKIIALSQFRDAIREVAINQIYRSLQHRDELYLAILEALEELEDELEELLEREEDEEGEGEEGEEEGEEEQQQSHQ